VAMLRDRLGLQATQRFAALVETFGNDIPRGGSNRHTTADRRQRQQQERHDDSQPPPRSSRTRHAIA
jgi:hypothetical protein